MNKTQKVKVSIDMDKIFSHTEKTIVLAFLFDIYASPCHNNILENDVASVSEITPCNKINKPLVVYRFKRNVMTSITTLRT